MPLRVLFAASAADWADFADPIRAACADAGLTVDLSPDHAEQEADYIIFAPSGRIPDFAAATRARAVLSLWAGVERIVTQPGLTQPLARMVAPGMTAAMVEYVIAHVLRHHLEIDRDITRRPGDWDQRPIRTAASRPVTILGQGELGRACATALTAFGFPVTGWSRSPRHDATLARSLHGDEGLVAALTGAEIVVTLLPRTPETENILDAARLSLTARGTVIINPGRGALIDDAALLAALDSGQIGHATLDVFRVEPLPPDHPFWHHPKVTVTPHIAAYTPTGDAARLIAENIRRTESGLPLLHEVDRTRGY
jgi:glyoxylate/hydroxypyruvate reductase A